MCGARRTARHGWPAEILGCRNRDMPDAAHSVSACGAADTRAYGFHRPQTPIPQLLQADPGDPTRPESPEHKDRTLPARVRTHRLTLPLGEGRIPSPPRSMQQHSPQGVLFVLFVLGGLNSVLAGKLWSGSGSISRTRSGPGNVRAGSKASIPPWGKMIRPARSKLAGEPPCLRNHAKESCPM